MMELVATPPQLVDVQRSGSGRQRHRFNFIVKSGWFAQCAHADGTRLGSKKNGSKDQSQDCYNKRKFQNACSNIVQYYWLYL